MEIRIGNDIDKERILGIRPIAAPYFTNDYFLVAQDGEGDILGFATVSLREIPAPVPGREAFILLIEILEEENYRKGIASLLVQKIIELEKEKDTYQVRAYCDIWHEESHRLWWKNGFGISPVKKQDGSILGSFVTYAL